MAEVELVMPKMGESIMEATILNWVKKEGDYVEVDETILEIATDKVDSEVPAPVSGTISKILFQQDETVEIGKVIAVIQTEAEGAAVVDSPAVAETSASSNGSQAHQEPAEVARPAIAATVGQQATPVSSEDRFYSPLVRNIAKEEGISQQELDRITGSGLNGRVTKHDILAYLDQRTAPAQPQPVPAPTQTAANGATKRAPSLQPSAPVGDNVEIIEMDRMRRMIADHMVHSVQTAPHVTSFVEVDVTNLFNWRNRAKKVYLERYGEKITFTPIFIEAVVKAIQDFPLINASVDGNRILRKKDINVGMAAALPSGNLIVPVIKHADHLNLVGLTKKVNDLAGRARANQLKPEEIQGGTFTITNVGTFGNVMGTPIINQPQVAILATGAIRKKPAVVETEYGDVVAVRQMMYLSLSYDHRVVDGFLGGSFLRRVGDYLEAFAVDREI